MLINKLLTKINFRAASNRQIKYIVIHYVGATGGAKDNCLYFEKEYRGASAHYFVGHKGEVWQCVEDKDVSWHCGADSYKHPEARNDNSIGIELCCRKDAKGNWYFEDATYTTAIELVKELMAKYNVPISNVIRHYDVTGKVCPEPFVSNKGKYTWTGFKNALTAKETVLDNTPDAYAVDAVNWAVANGILKGTAKGDYKLHSSITRQDMLTFLYRAIGK